MRKIAMTLSLARGARSVTTLAKSGPMWPRVAELGADGPTDVEWKRHADALRGAIGGSDELAAAVRVEQLYLPIFFWCRAQRLRTQRTAPGSACVIFVSAPQGSGKSTLVRFLEERFAADGLKCAQFSYDDVYLTATEQTALASCSQNELLELRGAAGTHDLGLGAATLDSLKKGQRTPLPAYDKSLHEGRGDRLPQSEWPVAEQAVDVVLFEGWMAGFKPLDDVERCAAIDTGLPAVDCKLGDYAAWDAVADAWVVLGVDDTQRIFDWRLEAERQMAKANGGAALNDDKVRDFVRRFLPSYEAYTPALYEAATKGGVDGKPTLCCFLDEKRSPVEAKAKE